MATGLSPGVDILGDLGWNLNTVNSKYVVKEGWKTLGGTPFFAIYFGALKPSALARDSPV